MNLFTKQKQTYREQTYGSQRGSMEGRGKAEALGTHTHHYI